MDDTNLRTASVYINNLLLSRGLLRNGQTIDFAHPERGDGGADGTMGRIMGVVNDLILRRDRDATQRESLSTTLRTVRAESLQQTSEVEQLKAKLGDSTRKLGLADASERALKMQLRSAEAAAKGLKEERARMRSLVAQTRAQCANEVRKRERVIEGLKKHVGEGGRARGSGKATGVATITVVAGVGEKEANNSESQLGEEYDLRSETNEFLTELASGLSEDNEKLGALIRRMVDTLKALSGWEKEGEQEDGLIVNTEEGYEAIAAEADNVIEHLRTLLTNPSFVPLEEVEVREEEIFRLRGGWERMEERWKDAVKMMDGWRKRMTSTGQAINLEELRLGMSLSPIKEGDAEEMYTQNLEDEYGEGDTQDDIDAMNDNGVPLGDLEEMSETSSFEERDEDVLQPQEAEIEEADPQVDEPAAAEAVDAELEDDDDAIDSDDSWAAENSLTRKDAREYRESDQELPDHAQWVVDQTKRNRQMLTRTLAEDRIYERQEETKRSQEEEYQKQKEAEAVEKSKTKVERKRLEDERAARLANEREAAKVTAEGDKEMREIHRESIREQKEVEDEAHRLLLRVERRQPPPSTSARNRAARRMERSESESRPPKQPNFSSQTTNGTSRASKEDQPMIDSLVDNLLGGAPSTLSNSSASNAASTTTASQPQTGSDHTATAELAPATQPGSRRKRKSGDILERTAKKRVASEPRMKQRHEETRAQDSDSPHLRNMSDAEQNEADSIPDDFPADLLEPLSTAPTRSTRSTRSQTKDVLSSSPLPEVPKLSPLRQAPIKEVPVKHEPRDMRKSVLSSATNELESSSRSITYEHQFSPAKKSSLSREYHPSPIFSAPTLAPPEPAVPQRRSSRRKNEKPWDENVTLSPVKLTNTPISSMSLNSLKSPEKLPKPAEQPLQQSPLTMASIAAKLAATEREADAARVRAKLKAAKAKRAAAAAVAASTTTTKVKVKTGKSPVKKMDDATQNMEESEEQPKKRKPMSREHRRSRRRSTLSPWELESLILGGVQESPSK